MDKKLTLRLDAKVIENAKIYAAQKKISLSRLIESYFQSLTSETDASEYEISPFVKSISNGVELPCDIEDKKEYRDHLIEKYK